jgi:biotin operon repressor
MPGIVYAISTRDVPEFKSLFCGRRNDVAELLDHLSKGHSVAIFGERKIGKTSLLYIVRDIINGETDAYQADLIDLELQSTVESLKTKAPKGHAIFVGLLGLTSADSEGLVRLLHRELQTVGLLDTDFKRVSSLSETLIVLDKKMADDERIVILMDEMEVLLGCKESRQIFGNLRSVIQSCPHTCFVFAGAEYWYKPIKQKTSPLVGNVRVLYLKAAAQFPTEAYLIANPLKDYLSSGCDIAEVTRTVVEWTACKPYYVQAACLAITEVCTKGRQLPEDWRTVAQERVGEIAGPILDAFYISDSLDTLSTKILALLANKPGLTVKELAQKLGYSEKVIWDKVDDLEALDKVRKRGSEYRVVGTLIERWGQRTQDVPKVKNPWLERVKWAGTVLLLALAVWVYSYTHPPLYPFSFDFPNGVVVVRMPSSLEQEESGITEASIQNTSPTTIYSVTVSLMSGDVDYQLDGTNRVCFDSLAKGEKRYWKSTFLSRASISGDFFESQILIVHGAISSDSYRFDIPRRVLPIKRYWGLVSTCLVALNGFLFKQELAQLASSVIHFLLSRNKDNS